MNLTLKKSDVPQHLLKYFTINPPKYKSGDLVDTPHLVANALQDDGWILRQDIIWAKPSPMPESVRNRCTKSHEYVFLLAKKMGYYYDAEAIKEISKDPESHKGHKSRNDQKFIIQGGEKAATRGGFPEIPEGKTYKLSNKRSVWRVSSQGYEGAHFAVFPGKLITPMILAGTSEKGCCADCSTPWKRMIEEKKLTRERPNDYVKYAEERGVKSGLNKDRGDGGRSNVGGTSKASVNSCSNFVAGVEVKTVGWEPGCECNGKFVKEKVVIPPESEAEKASRHDGKAFRTERYTSGNMYDNSNGTDPGWMNGALGSKGGERNVLRYVSDLPLDEHPVIPCTVLDPFMGSGTTACVSIAHGRRVIGIDLSEDYLSNNAIPRIEGELMSRPDSCSLINRKVDRIEGGSRMA